MAFAKGKPKTGGRKAGTPNKLTADAKEAFRRAAEQLGGVDALTDWARTAPDKFWTLYARLIPIDHTSAGAPLPAPPPAVVQIELVHPPERD